jgi:hypothetical protein
VVLEGRNVNDEVGREEEMWERVTTMIKISIPNKRSELKLVAGDLSLDL